MVLSSRDFWRTCIGYAFVLCLTGWMAHSHADVANFVQHQANTDTALNAVSDVAVSMDGRFVYTASTSSSAVSVFERDLVTGTLTYKGKNAGVIAAFSVDVSSDNKNVYAASPTGNAIHTFSRNIETGALTKVGEVTNAGGTRGFVSVSVSPDNKHVYGVGGYPGANGLVVFNRDQTTGALTVLHDYKANVHDHALGQLFSNTTSPIKNIVTSADGQFVYVTSTADHAVTLFSRNADTGALTQVAVYKDGVDGVDGLQAASSAKRSPDGKHLYVSGQGESSVAIFSIDNISGELTYLGKMTQGVGGVNTLTGVRSLAVSPDGRYVLASAITDDAVTVFGRNSSTGLLTVDGAVTNLVNGVTGLDAPSGMSTDPLNRHLYVAGQGASSLVVFSLPTPAVSLSTTTVTAQVSGSAIILDSQLNLFDSDSPNLASATVAISGGFIDTDLLAVQSTAGINASYDALNGVLSITGVASVADYQTLLRSLSYQAGADASLGAGASSTRQIGIQVTDDDGNTSAAAIVTVTVEKPDGFTVTFVDWDSAILSSQLLALGEAATAPAAPGRVGYSFTGWDLAFDNVSADLTVTAQYTINTYTVTFDLNGGSRTGGGTLSQAVDHGLAATAPVFTWPAGATFTGWSTSFDAVSADLTVTAQYSINSYSVIFDLDGGSHTGGGALTQIVNYGLAATAPVFTPPLGKTFSGWSSGYDAVTTDLNITAQYTVNTYTVTFDLDGGSHAGGGALTQSVNYGLAAAAPVFTPPSGKTFSGWSSSFDVITADLTVTAQYTDNAYTVTFDLDGGNHTGGGAVVQTVNHGLAATAPVFTPPAGKTFSGWSAAFNAVTADLTVTALYAPNAHTVIFDLDGGSRTGGGALVQTVTSGQSAIAPIFTAPSGKTFAGWSTSLNNVTSNRTITAQYSLDTYTVRATLVGEGTITPATQSVASGADATFSLNLAHAGDYVSLGGSCKASLSGNRIVVSSVTANCAITVSVYPSLEVDRDSDKPLASNLPRRFSVTGGAGEKSLTGALLKRAGEETVLDLNEANALISLQDDGSYLFNSNRTGRYSLTFVDSVSGEGTAVSFDVLPYVAFTSSTQPVQQDNPTALRIWLSDEPIEYPVIVNYVAAGAVLSAEQFILTAADKLDRAFEVAAIAETANVRLGATGLTGALIGTPAVHTLAVQQDLPLLSLIVKSMQAGQQTTVVDATSGEVVLTVAELNNAAATYQWSSDGLILNPNGARANFDPAMVPAGTYTITVHASTLDGRTGKYDFVQRVIAGCPVASCENTGTTGIPASVNVFASAPNHIPVCPNVGDAVSRVDGCQVEGSASLYAEVPGQYTLSVGELSGDQSWETGQFGIAVNNQTFIDSAFNHLGITLNFDIAGLEYAGEAVSIAIPLPVGTTIPVNAVWRKYINNQWQNFVVDDDNLIHSAARNAVGHCPGVSSDVWVEGLVVGNDCVRLTIQDGGPNDADGSANSVIRDPGVLAVAVAPEEPKPPVTPTPTPTPPVDNGNHKSSSGSTGFVSVLLLCLLGLLRCRRIRAITPL